MLQSSIGRTGNLLSWVDSQLHEAQILIEEGKYILTNLSLINGSILRQMVDEGRTRSHHEKMEGSHFFLSGPLNCVYHPYILVEKREVKSFFGPIFSDTNATEVSFLTSVKKLLINAFRIEGNK